MDKVFAGTPGGGRGRNNFNGPEEAAVKRLGKRGVIARLGRYLLHFKWLLILAFVMSLASNMLSLVGPKLSGLAIDAIEPGVGKVDFGKVYYYAGLMALLVKETITGDELMAYVNAEAKALEAKDE